MIRLVNVSKHYQTGDKPTIALNNINLELPDSGFISILGPSGCGKSTLLNLLGLLDQPTTGEIYFDEIKINTLPQNKKDSFRNKMIGFIFQSYHLIPTLSILDNIILPVHIGRKHSYLEARKRGLALLKAMGLAEYANRKVSQMSGGQIQRAAIARALINEPEVILGDEPTGALDSKNTEETLRILKEISKKRLVIIVTHDKKSAETYSDQIINLNDGKIESISGQIDNKNNRNLGNVQTNLPLPTSSVGKISGKSFLSKKFKAALTGFANSFGLVALGFVLATTSGFNMFKDKVNRETASNLPINIPAYSAKTESGNWESINQSQEYPKEDEIYPYVPITRQVTYTYNHFSQEYINLLDSLVKQGLLTEYIMNIGNSYYYNLATEYPESIDGNEEGSATFISTTLSAGGDYTSSKLGIPTNIFHVLYGNPSASYDVIAGKMPKKSNELVLVVDEYNAINFSTLQRLGFYNPSDSVKQIQDPELKTKVKPISFDDILGKKYKIFSNDDIYEKTSYTQSESDLFDYDNGVKQDIYKRDLILYSKKNIKDLYNNEDSGVELTITGIIRPKKGTTQALLAPSLCFLEDLQNEIMERKQESDIVKDIQKNVVMINNDPQSITKMLEDFSILMESNKDFNDISTTEVNSFANSYFRYYSIDDGNYHKKNEDETFRYTDFTTFLAKANELGCSDLVLDETKQILSTGSQLDIHGYFTKIKGFCLSSNESDHELAYRHMISVVAYANSYSNVIDIALFPAGLSERTKVIEKLDEFNKNQTVEAKKVYYLDNTNSFVRDLGELISLVNLILSIFVTIMILVAVAMNILFTYNNVLERTKDIGIFRALGMRRFDVSRIFIVESAFVGLISGIVAVTLTFILEIPVNHLVAATYSRYFKYTNLCITSWWHVLLLLALGLALGIFSSLIPSYKASRKDPVKCLKDE